ncbi:MAG: DUF4157 domain-containing protein [Cytophagaceae bacterium]|nr:DUF4157 domain-containing protein [Gemmatimonadaceae bacterium]
MAFLARLAAPVIGSSDDIPAGLLEAFPELGVIRLRRGGLPARVGGWCLGRAWVDGITVGRQVWLSPTAAPSAELLLHELCHVHQFQAVRAFPLRYWWESLRRGYVHNRFEVDARRFAAERLTGRQAPLPQLED